MSLGGVTSPCDCVGWRTAAGGGGGVVYDEANEPGVGGCNNE